MAARKKAAAEVKERRERLREERAFQKAAKIEKMRTANMDAWNRQAFSVHQGLMMR